MAEMDNVKAGKRAYQQLPGPTLHKRDALRRSLYDTRQANLLVVDPAGSRRFYST